MIAGYKNGFIKSLFHFAGFIIALLGASFLSRYVTELLNSTPLRQLVAEKIAPMFDAGELSISVNQNVPKLIAQSLDNTISSVIDKATQTLINTATNIIMGIIGAIIAFVLCVIIVQVIAFILDSVFSLPILSTINRFAGFFLGAGNGIIILYIALAIIGIFFYDEFAPYIRGSVITREMYYNNILLELITFKQIV